MSEKIVKLQDAQIYQGKSLILQDVSLVVEEGEFVYLIGKTGSGKSSLLKTLYGELYLKEGRGRVAGFNLTQLTWKMVPLLRRNLGIIFQDFQLLTDRSIYDNLLFVLKSTGWKNKKTIKDKIESVLEEVHLAGKGYRKPYEMSGGEQQRVDIARALLNNPKLILADEPTGNLDPDTTDYIMQLLANICKSHQTAIIMATHDYSILQKFPGRIVKIADGSVQDTVLAQPSSESSL